MTTSKDKTPRVATNLVSYTTDGRVKHYSKEDEINDKLGSILGEKFVKYREVWDAANRFEIVTEYPLFVQFDIHQKCNLRCAQCLHRYPDRLKEFYGGEEALSWNGYKRVVLESEEHNCPSITLCGLGEPLTMPNFENYIKYAHKHGFMDIMINTNATLLTEERARGLLDCGLTRLRFSIDAASPETYARVRGKDYYHRVVKNIEKFLELKEKMGYRLPVTGVSFCELSINEHEMDSFIEFWEDKVDMVTTQRFYPMILEKELNVLYPSCQVGHAEDLASFRCVQPFQRVVIQNQEIRPCCFLDKNLKIGNIKKDTIYGSWHSEKMNGIRELCRTGRYDKNKGCSNCTGLLFPREAC